MSPKDTVIEQPSEPEETAELFNFEILKIIKESQQQHGLRHGDFQRYRGYCTRRISRLRKVLKLPQGDRRHFKKKDVTAQLLSQPKTDLRCLLIPLIQAERAWAHAMQLRQESNTEPRKRFHLIQRLRKSCQYSEDLEVLTRAPRVNARGKLEAQAYNSWMQATLFFELQNWGEASTNFKKSQIVYETIIKTLPEDEHMSYAQKINEIQPNLRYCAYNTGQDKSLNLLDLHGLDDLMNQMKQTKSEDVLEIKWMDLTVVVRSDKPKLFLSSLTDYDASLVTSDVQQCVKLLEQLLIDCRDAISVARDEVRLNQTGSQLLLTYLLWVRLTRTVQRNLYLIELAKKPQDSVRLFEIILQQMTEMKLLSGLEGNEEYQKDIDLLVVGYKAHRCFYMAKSLTLTRKWRESCVLLQKSLKYIAEISDKKIPEEMREKLQKLQQEIDAELIVAQAQCVIDETVDEVSVLPVKPVKNKKPMIDRLDEYREDTQLLTKNPNVVNLPPQMEPIPCKPLFFDLAFNLVKFPDVQDRLEPASNKNKTNSGMSGFVKGLFGWGGKK